MPIRIKVNQAELHAFLASPAGPVFAHIDDLAMRTAQLAATKAPRDEGHLAASIEHQTRVEGTTVIGWAGSGLDYALYVHEGTGIYGPRQQRIYPVTARVLAFEPSFGLQKTRPKGKRGFVFAYSVAGMKGTPYLVDALREISPYPIRMHPSG